MTPGPQGGPRARSVGETPRTAREMLERARAFLARKGIGVARLEAELLVAHALGLDRLRLFLDLDRPVAAAEVAGARDLLVRRGGGEPVAYITGEREFYGRAFRVGPGVLIPRPETELLVDLARERFGGGGSAGLAIADFGTGSGCLAVTLALELPGSRVDAVDVSAEALRFARENAQRLGAQVRWVVGEGIDALPARDGYDLLVANPPYVDPGERDALPVEIREHEPEEALYAPPGDPDHWVRRLLDGGVARLRGGGRLLIELGHDQAVRARALAGERGLSHRIHRDLGGVERALEVEAG